MAGAGAWWSALEFDAAPKIIARLPFVDRADHPAAVPVFVVSRVAPDTMVKEVEVWSVRVAGWSAAAAQAVAALAEVFAVPDRAFDGAALLVSVPQGGNIEQVTDALIKVRRLGTRLRPSSAAMPRAIGSKARGRPNCRADPPECEMSVLQRPQPRPGVLAIDPYVPGKSTAPGVERVFKLSSNETPLGPSPEGDRRVSRARRSTCRIIPTAPRPTCGRRSDAPSGSTPIASFAARAPTSS